MHKLHVILLLLTSGCLSLPVEPPMTLGRALAQNRTLQCTVYINPVPFPITAYIRKDRWAMVSPTPIPLGNRTIDRLVLVPERNRTQLYVHVGEKECDWITTNVSSTISGFINKRARIGEWVTQTENGRTIRYRCYMATSSEAFIVSGRVCEWNVSVDIPAVS